MDTASLHVLPLHAGLGPHSEVAPIDVTLPAPSRATFLLRLPDAFVGDVTVEVAAYKGAGATSCVLATGSAKLNELQGLDSSLRDVYKRQESCSTRCCRAVRRSAALARAT